MMDLFSRSPDIHNGVSGHCETVCLLSKLNVEHYIEKKGL